ncbi:MAG: polyhydroxyalkanoate synthesis regulator DNA-binding domain-containing protein [Vicinamibacteria bacterium]
MNGPHIPVVVTVIKRYENRKLYDPQARAYVTLADLSRMVTQGGEIQVVDQKTGEDLTTLVLAQVVLEGVKERTADVPRQVLARLIRLAARPASAWTEPAQEAATRARAEAERIAAGLIAKGRLTLDEALAVRQEIAGSVQRLVADAQHGIESRFRGLFEGTGGPGEKLRTLEEKLDAFEQALEPAAVRPRRKPRAGRRKS